MPLDQKSILGEIDFVIKHVTDLTENSRDELMFDLPDYASSEASTLLRATIERFAPEGSSFRTNINSTRVYGGPHGLAQSIKPLMGILRALRLSYEQGFLTSIQELIHADVFSDFLEMATHLADSGYKDASAVIIGSVLEEHLRKLATKNGINILKPDNFPKKADTLNAELGASAYSKLDQKSVTVWLDLRNQAAHGNYSVYSKDQVAFMLDGVRNFIARLPA